MTKQKCPLCEGKKRLSELRCPWCEGFGQIGEVGLRRYRLYKDLFAPNNKKTTYIFSNTPLSDDCPDF